MKASPLGDLMVLGSTVGGTVGTGGAEVGYDTVVGEGEGVTVVP